MLRQPNSTSSLSLWKVDVFFMKATKIFLILALVCVGCTVLCGAVSAEEMRTFVDDVGREVVLPVEIDAVSPSGPLAQTVLYSLDPDLFVSVSATPSAMEQKYLDPRLMTLPETGQFYGSKASTMNPESIMELNKQLHIDVVLDIGEAKGTMKEDLNDISGKTGVSFAFITQNKLSDIPGSYLKLGELLDRKEQGGRLSAYASSLLAEFDAGMKTVGENKKSLIYVSSIDGNAVSLVGNGSYHANVIDYVGNNVGGHAVSSSGTGDGYTMEDILQMNPDFIIVSFTTDHAYYNKILNDPLWQSLSAVRNGNVYEAPCGPYSWMGPSSPLKLLMLMWLGNLMYPEVFSYDIHDRVKEFYPLFFHYDLTDAELDELMVYAVPNSSPAPAATQASVPIAGICAGAAVALAGVGCRRFQS